MTSVNGLTPPVGLMFALTFLGDLLWLCSLVSHYGHRWRPLFYIVQVTPFVMLLTHVLCNNLPADCFVSLLMVHTPKNTDAKTWLVPLQVFVCRLSKKTNVSNIMDMWRIQLWRRTIPTRQQRILTPNWLHLLLGCSRLKVNPCLFVTLCII